MGKRTPGFAALAAHAKEAVVQAVRKNRGIFHGWFENNQNFLLPDIILQQYAKFVRRVSTGL